MSENDFECFANTGVKTTQMAMHPKGQREGNYDSNRF
jgi:hypothetical protein